jgi:hypothetical protein
MQKVGKILMKNSWIFIKGKIILFRINLMRKLNEIFWEKSNKKPNTFSLEKLIENCLKVC